MNQKKIIEFAKDKVGGFKALSEELGLSESFLRTLACGSNRIPFKKIKALAKITAPEVTEQEIFNLRSKQ